jgi:hypothetical protein
MSRARLAQTLMGDHCLPWIPETMDDFQPFNFGDRL